MICSGPADILEARGGERNDVGALDREAIRGFKLTAPEVQVTVQPAAVQVIERAPQYRMQAKYDDHDRLVDLIVFSDRAPGRAAQAGRPSRHLAGPVISGRAADLRASISPWRPSTFH